MKLSVILISLLALLASCAEDGPELQSEKMPLVVEGWIEEGESPVIIVTHAVDLTVETPSFDDFVEKWGRVTLYDNGRPYILTGKVNSNFTPSLIFTSSRLKGELGHTYRLTIETVDDFAEGQATLEAAPRILSIHPLKEKEGYSLMVNIDETFGTIQFQTMTLGVDSRFYPAFCSTYAGNPLGGGEYKITKGAHAAYDEDQADKFSNFFSPGETVLVKVCRIPDELYSFWTAYDQAVSLGGNIFLNIPQNCQGNISGGLGYFSAAGISITAVTIPK